MVYTTSNQKTEVNHRTIHARRANETLNSIPVRPSKRKLNVHEHTRRDEEFFLT
jgi:hypothetical protein